MKLIPALFLAALAAFFVFPLPFEWSVSALATAGLLAIAGSDYHRRMRPLRTAAATAAAALPLAERKERFGLAA